MSGQNSNPSVPTNPPAYPAAKPQQQRTGPIIVGASTSTSTSTSTSNKRPAASTRPTAATRSPATRPAAAASSSSSSSSNTKNHPPVVPPPGRGANDSLSMLGAYGSNNGNGKKRRADNDNDHYLNVLERLVPPLFLCDATNSIGTDGGGGVDGGNVDDDGNGGVKNSKKRKEGGANNTTSESNVNVDAAKDRHDQPDEKEKDPTSCPNNINNISDSKIEYHKQLRKELERQKQQNKMLMERRKNVFQSMVALHEMYETGLDGIARMNDLRFVPDNVMPDNIPR